MKRHFLEWGLLVLAVGAMVALLSVGKGPAEGFDGLVVNKDRWYELMSAREKTDEGLVSKVTFNQEELMTAEEGTEWYYSLVEGQGGSKNPEVRYRSESGVRLAVLEDKITDEKIRSGESLKVMAYSEGKYELYDLYVTTLPVMSVSHKGAIDMSKDDDEEGMQLKLFDNRAGATQRLVMTDGKIKVRGAMASMMPKRSFRMKLRTTSVGENRRANNASLLGMRQDDDWILYAGYNDQEKIRNVFAMDLWKEGQAKENEFGLDNGMEYKYVELIMNDSYYGLYALGYPIDELVMELKREAGGVYSEFIFKKGEWSGVRNGLDAYELKTESVNIKFAWSELDDYEDEMRYGRDVETLRELTDMKSAINLYLFIELAQSMDTLSASDDDTKNLYLTAKEWGKGYKWVYTPWDMDLTFGNHWKETAKNMTDEYSLKADEEFELTGSVVVKLKKLGDEEIENELRSQYRELRERYWSDEHISELIDEYEREIYRSGAFSRDMERWPEGNYNDPDEELIRFKEYVLNRLSAMDKTYL